jgi:hypothetical protein
MTSAIEIHTHLLELDAERALASIEGLAVNSAGLRISETVAPGRDAPPGGAASSQAARPDAPPHVDGHGRAGLMNPVRPAERRAARVAARCRGYVPAALNRQGLDHGSNPANVVVH